MSLTMRNDQFIRAAEELITDFGDEALDTAKRRAENLRREGFDSFADTWVGICEAIKHIQASPRQPEHGHRSLVEDVATAE